VCVPLNSVLPPPFQLHLPPPSAAQAIALLEATDADPDTLLDIALKTPALIVAMLWMRPLLPTEDVLRTALAERLARAGTPLLKAWLLHASAPGEDAHRVSRRAIRSLHLSRVCGALASASGWPHIMSAELAGLWLGAGELCLAASVPDHARVIGDGLSEEARFDREQEHFGTDALQVSARMAAACGLGAEIEDAILMSRLSASRLEGAHPLACLVHAAHRLADESADLDALSGLTGVAAPMLAEMRARFLNDVTHDQIQGADTSYPAVPPPWQATLLASLGGDIFSARVDDVDASLEQAFRLLFCSRAPLLLSEQQGRLLPFAVPADATAQAMARRVRELELALDDETSIVALAVRSQAITTQYVGRDTPSRSAKDWHLARWLGHRSLTCMPFDIGGQRGVGVIGERDDPSGLSAQQRLMAQLVIQAARSHFRDALMRHQIETHATDAREALMTHVRRIKHEASGPLTVLQTQLSLMASRHSDAEAPVSLDEIGRELSRVNEVLAELTQSPQASIPRAEASVNLEVGRLGELYAHALFEQHGRHLDIKLPPHLPRVAMTPKALTQVLLNLMRNAAEALPEGGSLSIRSSGVAITGGRPCVEILLKDDGPGLPPARQKALFEPAPSTKGEGHEGIGLSIVKSLLDEHGAYIFCRTIKNQGTSFQIYVPVVDS